MNLFRILLKLHKNDFSIHIDNDWAFVGGI